MTDTVIAPVPTGLTGARRANYELNRKEHREKAHRLDSRPLAVFVELTQNCNLHCASCRSAGVYHPEWNMASSTFELVADALFDTALMVDLRGWGESTINRAFPPAVDRVVESGAAVRLVTNGQVNLPDVWHRIMASGGCVAVSCDAGEESLFAELRAGGTLKRLRQTARALVQARDAEAALPDAVSFQVVVSGANVEHLTDIVRLAHDLDVRKIVLGPIQTEVSDPLHLRHHVEACKEALDECRELASATGVTFQLGSALDSTLAIPEAVKDDCMHPWAFAYVTYAGDVGFCDHLIGSPRFTFGNIHKSSFESIWNSDDWTSLRAAHAARDLPDRFYPCRWCYKQRYIDFEHLLYPDYAAGLVTNCSASALYEIRPVTSEPLPFL